MTETESKKPPGAVARGIAEASTSWRKLFVWVATVVIVVFAEVLDLDLVQLSGIVGAAGSFHIGQGLADFGKHKSK